MTLGWGRGGGGVVYTGADTGLSVGCISADKVRGEGEAFSTRLPDQRPAGERAGYQGKNNTHTIRSSRHRRAREREEETDSEEEGRGSRDGQEGWITEGWTVTERQERKSWILLLSQFFLFPVFCTA